MNSGGRKEQTLATLRLDERFAEINWPGLQEIDVPPVEVGDCLLVCAGFEERSVEVLRRICDTGNTDLTVILVDYLPRYGDNRFEELSDMCRRANLTMTECIYDRRDPAGSGERFGLITRRSRRVFLDISGMSRLLIVQMLVALIEQNDTPISLLYGEAETYLPSEEEFRAAHGISGSGGVRSYLSSGIIEVASTPELASVSMLGESIRLIGFPSFDPSQLDNLLHELQPMYVDVVHGLPPSLKDQWRREAIASLNEDALDALQRKEEHEASTLDYRETLDILLKIYAERSTFDRLVVAPTGSKMQTVAVGLFRAALHDVQVVYPTPQVFAAPHRYTLGCRQLYKLDLPGEVRNM